MQDITRHTVIMVTAVITATDLITVTVQAMETGVVMATDLVTGVGPATAMALVTVESLGMMDLPELLGAGIPVGLAGATLRTAGNHPAD